MPNDTKANRLLPHTTLTTWHDGTLDIDIYREGERVKTHSMDPAEAAIFVRDLQRVVDAAIEDFTRQKGEEGALKGLMVLRNGVGTATRS